MNKCYVIYMGPSLNNCPRIKLLNDTIKEMGMEFFTIAITKNSSHGVLPYNYVEYNYNSNILFLKKILLAWCFFRLLLTVLILRPKLLYCINPISGIIGVVAKHVFKTKIIYETQEIFGGVDYRGVGQRLRSALVCFDAIAARQSNCFVATDQFRAKFLRRFYKLTGTQTRFIYNVSEPEPIDDSDISELLIGLRKQFSKIALYAGGVSADRGIVELTKVAEHFNDNEYAFVLAGTNDGSVELSQLSAPNIFRIENPTHTELKYLAAQADVAFALYRPTTVNNRFASPNKIFDSIEVGVPIITTTSPLARHIANETSLCFCVDWKTDDRMVSDISTVLKDNVLSRAPAQLSNFTYLAGKNQVRGIMLLVLSQKPMQYRY
jgi:hypothetical protein